MDSGIPLSRLTTWRPPVARFTLRLFLILAPFAVAVMVINPLSLNLRFAALGMIIAAFAVILFLRSPSIVLVLIAVTAVAPPLMIGTGSQTALTLPVVLVPLMAGIWLFKMIAIDRKITLYLSRPVLAILGLSLAAALSFVVGQLPWFPLQQAPIISQLGGLAIFVLSAAAFIVAANQRREQRWLEWAVWLFLLLSGLQLLGRVVPGLGLLRGLFHPMDRSYYVLWTVALASSQALFNHRLRGIFRIILGILVIIALYMTFFKLRAWASGWLPSFIALVVVLLAARPRLGAMLALFGAAVGIIFASDIIDTVVVSDNLYSMESRLSAWRILAEITMVNPVLGLGPANYYWYTPLYSIEGFKVQFNSHNQYVDLIAQVGLLGFFFFVWWAIETGRAGWQARLHAKPGFQRAFVYGALGGLAGMLASGMLGDWVLPFVYNIGLEGFRSSVIGWTFLGALVAVGSWNRATGEQVDIPRDKT